MEKRPDFMKVIMVLCFAAVAVIFVSKQSKPKGEKNNYEIISVKKEQREIKTTIEGIIENFISSLNVQLEGRLSLSNKNVLSDIEDHGYKVMFKFI